MNQMFRRLFFVVSLIAVSVLFFFLYKDFKSKLLRKSLLVFNNINLYEDELEGLNADEKEKYIDDWIIAHFLEKEFEKINDEISRKEIERKISFYKSHLLAHIYLEKLVNKEINIDSEEIEKYYNDNASSFLLQEIIFKGILIIIPKNLKENKTIKVLLESPIKNIDQLKSCCFKVAREYHLTDNEWQLWKERLISTPYTNRRIDTKYFSKDKLFIEYDKTYAYYLWITDIKHAGEIAPISLVRDKIKKKIQIIKRLEIEKTILKNILSKVKNDNNFK